MGYDRRERIHPFRFFMSKSGMHTCIPYEIAHQITSYLQTVNEKRKCRNAY